MIVTYLIAFEDVMMNIFRNSIGYKLKDRIRNAALRKELKICNLNNRIRNYENNGTSCK
jgi:hypothetical protein